MSLPIFELDPTLKPCEGQIWDRVNGYKHYKENLEKNEGGLLKFSEGYKIFGFNRVEGGYVYREWLPNAKQVFLIGDFNEWANTTPLQPDGFGRWMVMLPDNKDGSPMIPHKSQLKVRLETNDGNWHERVPAWAKLAWQDHKTNLFNGVFWEPPQEERFTFKHPRPARPEGLKIYEAHVGMASIEPKVATYTEFADTVLPRIRRLGYNAVQLMAVAEHAHYGCFGYHVTSFFAPASRSGTPEELKYLVDQAHGLGIIVLMDLVHAHASSNTLDGIAQMDGTDHCYTHGGPKGHHSEWDSKIFDYLKPEVLRFLLSNVRWWIEEYGFDGFRFDGITSMLYHSHGIGKGYTGGYHEYFGPDADIDSHIYLMLANEVIHTMIPTAVTVGEDVSGMPTLCRPVEDGGFGFDYRLAMAIPDMFIKLLKEQGDEGWDMGHITHTLTNRRWKEKVIAYAESHDQAIVGDKTLAFWLMDAEMYTGMSCVTSPYPSMCVDRGLALHKMIRLVVLGLGGEGYLNFMGNEFGHPEWIDFPRPENDWSHHHCRRRFDLADDDLLRYKFFQAFDELMQACENRYRFMRSENQYVSVKNEGDKVICFERGPLLFCFNFHPTQGYEGYQVGMSFDEPMRTVLDSDEGRFGGHMRLEYGHSNSFPLQGPTHDRPQSIKLYLPPRTAQVLVGESACKGGVRVWLGKCFLSFYKLGDGKDLKLELITEGDAENPKFAFEGGCAVLANEISVSFKLLTGKGEAIECKASPTGAFSAYFPGDYTVTGIGYLEAQKPSGVQATAMPTRSTAIAPAPAAPKAATPAAEPAKAAPPAAAVNGKAGYTATPAPEAPVMNGDKANGKEPEEEHLDDLMQRNYSGLHFLAAAEEAEKAEKQAAKQAAARLRSPSAEDVRQKRGKSFQAALKDMKSGVVEYSRSYKTFGLLPAGMNWTFCEWIPHASAVFLVGDFNTWNTEDMPLEKSKTHADVWVGDIRGPKAAQVKTGSKYKLFVHPEEGEPYYVLPSWCTRFVFTEDTNMLDAVVCPIEEKSAPKPLDTPLRGQSGSGEKIYECHLGLAAREGKSPSFAEATEFLLPRVAANGYTAVLLIGVQECKEYASMGLQPVGYFAPSKDLGTPEELQAFVAKAHSLKLRVLMSVAHDGAACCEDGLGGHMFIPGAAGFNPRTGARIFDYSQTEVQRFLLSNLTFWVEQFGIDGFRFQGVTATIYTDRGSFPPQDPSDVSAYSADGVSDKDGVQYLMLANNLLAELGKGNFLSIAEEHTLFPGICEPADKGGLGFSLRQTSAVPDYLRSVMSTQKDEEWSMDELSKAVTACETEREGDRVLGCMESSEECTYGRRPLKIAMLSWETLHTIAAGGVAPHVTELAAALHRQGHSVHIFTRSAAMHTWEHPVWGVQYQEVAFAHDSDFVREIENMCGAFVSRLLEVEGHIGYFDIIHGHDWLVGPAVAQLSAMGKRTVFTMHSTETGRCGNVAYAGQSARIRDIEGHACHCAERVIAVSGVLKGEVCGHYNVDGRKVEVIYNGIHAEPIVEMPWEDDWTGNTKRDKGFPEMAPMFLFVGRMAVQKGPDLLLEAIPFILQARGDAKFVFVGDGHMKAALEGRAQQLGISHAIYFAGSVKSGSAHLQALFKSCDAVVVPSRNEPFGIVVLEAWAAGKPVVATTCGGPRDFVTPDKNGYLVDPEPGSISWGVCKICENFEHARWMGAQAKQRALTEFSWHYIARQTERIYYEQLCMHGAPYRRSRGAGAPLAGMLLASHRDRMHAVHHAKDELVNRGLALHKMMRLLSTSLACQATLTWMGTDVGQIDAVDMPRAANGWNSDKARIAYDLADNKELRFKTFQTFELFVNRLEAVLGWLLKADSKVVKVDEAAKILAYVRGGCLFVYNFHPGSVAKEYRVPVAGADIAIDDKLFLALDSNDVRFGGDAALKAGAAPVQVRGGAITVPLLPARTALVYAPGKFLDAWKGDKVLQEAR
eukprot:TRINITY_DN22156_c0_g2_i1.p1 TRINITY_DN22156_c0_g2~~TRINITY_DN22156_c0_g2_i1.p1  ORF type:complete len:1969 (-),score=563.19 TRINITY_DN22156_c0_g2_i1:210-6116(-)